MINFINITPGSACLAPANAPTPTYYFLGFDPGAYYGCAWSSYLPTNFKGKQSAELKMYLRGDGVNIGMTTVGINILVYDVNGVVLTPITTTSNNVNIIDPAAVYTTTFELASYFTANSSWFILGMVRDTTFYAADIFPGIIQFLDGVIIPSSV